MVPGRDRRFTMRLPSHIGTSDSPVTRQPGSKRSTLNRLCKKAYPFNAPCSRQLARELPLWDIPQSNSESGGQRVRSNGQRYQTSGNGHSVG